MRSADSPILHRWNETEETGGGPHIASHGHIVSSYPAKKRHRMNTNVTIPPVKQCLICERPIPYRLHQNYQVARACSTTCASRLFALECPPGWSNGRPGNE